MSLWAVDETSGGSCVFIPQIYGVYPLSSAQGKRRGNGSNFPDSSLTGIQEKQAFWCNGAGSLLLLTVGHIHAGQQPGTVVGQRQTILGPRMCKPAGIIEFPTGTLSLFQNSNQFQFSSIPPPRNASTRMTTLVYIFSLLLCWKGTNIKHLASKCYAVLTPSCASAAQD